MLTYSQLKNAGFTDTQIILYNVETSNTSDYSSDLATAETTDSGYTNLQIGFSTVLKSVNLTKSVLFNGILYSTIHIRSSGYIGFNTQTQLRSFIGFFTALLHYSGNIYYKEEPESFIVIFKNQRHPFSFKINLTTSEFEYNFGTVQTAFIGFSVGTSSPTLQTSIDGYWKPPSTPQVNLNYSQKKITIKLVTTFIANTFNILKITAEQLKTAGFTAEQLKTAGFTAEQLITAGFTAEQLITAGFTAEQLITAGLNISRLEVINNSQFFYAINSTLINDIILNDDIYLTQKYIYTPIYKRIISNKFVKLLQNHS